MNKKIYNAIILNDYPNLPFATWVYTKVKTIETRMKRFKYRGDIVICCGNKSVGKNAGKALCIVRIAKVIPMKKRHEKKAKIECIPGRHAYILKDWRFFNKKFKFSTRRVSGAWQNIFQIQLPKNIKIND